MIDGHKVQLICFAIGVACLPTTLACFPITVVRFVIQIVCLAIEDVCLAIAAGGRRNFSDTFFVRYGGLHVEADWSHLAAAGFAIGAG